MEGHPSSVASGFTRQLSVAAGSVLGLRAAYSLAPQIGGWLVPRGLARATADVVWQPGQLLQQFTTYVAAVALAIVGAGLVAVLGRVAERKPPGAWVVAVAATLAGLGLGYRIAPTAGYLAAAVLFMIAVLAGPAVAAPTVTEPTRAPRAPMLVTGAELAALGWGLWLVFPAHPRLALGVVVRWHSRTAHGSGGGVTFPKSTASSGATPSRELRSCSCRSWRCCVRRAPCGY